jgi:hypothetical protein
MKDLHPCPSCRRHVVAGECPFCGATVIGQSRTLVAAGRLTRAAVLAAAVTACHGKKSNVDEPRRMPDQEIHSGGGGCVDPDPQRIEELKKQRESARTEEEKHRIDQEIQMASMPQCMPYGAPPTRRRVV